MNGSIQPTQPVPFSRRIFLRHCALGAAVVAAAPFAGCVSYPRSPFSRIVTDHVIGLGNDWRFGGKPVDGALAPDFNDSDFQKIMLPHCPVGLSWQKWDWKTWQETWCYRRHFYLPQSIEGQRVFLEFEGVIVGTEPWINGHKLGKHLGGYLPFQYEITRWVMPGVNVLAVAVDSRWSNVPPQGSPKGPGQIDYLEAPGIHRPVSVRMVPQIFISDVFARPVDVLKPSRRLEVQCAIDAAISGKSATLEISLITHERVIAKAKRNFTIDSPGMTNVSITLAPLPNIKLWDIDSPELYTVLATITTAEKITHSRSVRIGFRDARFDYDGFYLNGRRLQLFGLNRHEIFPYLGYAMPPCVKRRDAEILKRDYNCNFVRCSHYPQSPEFLDACDELGLLVWEEAPGWQYIGDAQWKDLFVRDVKDMIIRDRNRPSIVIWGTRANESHNDVELYRRTKELAHSLDNSRPSSGTMTTQSRKNWDEDVFAFDDYHSDGGGAVSISNAVPGVPYLVTESVGQFNYTTGKKFDSYYRRSGSSEAQALQALRHAAAHNEAARKPAIAGLIAWCAFEYSSLVNAYQAVKYPGIADVFRIPKLGAAFYVAQCDVRVRPVIEPNFYWDFGPQTPRGPGQNASLFSNCERLEIFVDEKLHATLHPDTANFPNLKSAPFFVDLDMDGANHPLLRVDGYAGGRLVLSRSFSSNSSRDQLLLQADDEKINSDDVDPLRRDATRLVFRVADEFGAPRAFGAGTVKFEIEGPGELVGDNPFDLTEAGGSGAVWIRAVRHVDGPIKISATHSALGTKTVIIQATGSAARSTFFNG